MTASFLHCHFNHLCKKTVLFTLYILWPYFSSQVTGWSIAADTCRRSSIMTGRLLTEGGQVKTITETGGCSAAPLWQSCSEGRCHRNEWASPACPWRPSLLSCDTSWKAAWSTGSAATARWCGGGSCSSYSWKHEITALTHTQDSLKDRVAPAVAKW